MSDAKPGMKTEEEFLEHFDPTAYKPAEIKDDVLEHSGMVDEELYHKLQNGELSDDELEQAGVKGMKWGVRKADKAPKLGPDGNPAKSRKELRGLDRVAKRSDRQAAIAKKKADAARNNAAIDAARGRVASGENGKRYRDAKAQYKIDKKVVGKYTAKKALDKAYNKNLADYRKSQEVKAGREATALALAEIGGELLKNYVAGRR